MKILSTFIIIATIVTFRANAQDEQRETLLDGTSMSYYYQNGSAAEVEFINGQFNFKWTAWPAHGIEGSEKYRSRKIGDKLYLINFMVEENSTFVTLVLNFNENVLSASALISPGSERERIMFKAGIIQNLTLKEK